jgi:PAS domain S-box-containing protein
MSTDITARKLAEEDLLIFRQMVASAQDAMCLVGRDYAYRIANEAYLQKVGLKADALVGTTVAGVFGKPFFEDIIQPRLDRCLAGEAVTYSEWFDFPGQGRRYAHITLSPCRNRTSEVIGAMVVAHDLTELQTAQKELKRLAAAIEQAAETVVVTDAAGAIQYVNPAFEQETGYRCEEAIGQNPRILKSGRHDDAFYRDMWNTLISGGTWQGQLVNKRKDGRLYTEKARISPVRDASGAICNYVAVKHDITKELEVERHFREAQKMQAVGTLAAGIAHDFNNVLGMIVGHAEMLQLKGAVAGPAAESVKQILTASMRAKDTVKQILMLSRRGRIERIPLNLGPVIKETSEFLRSSLPANIQLVVDLDAEAGTVSADPGQMQQVLMNLCTNAAQAMADSGGVLTLRLANTAPRQETGQLTDNPAEGGFVEISVSDTGAGIEPTVRERIFEPYFTTRDIGQGQGLGLSVVHGIVASHGGSLSVDSQVGQGTTLHVFLPCIQSNSKPESTPLGLLPKGRERILFIDDEKALARVGEMTLRHLGYRVNAQNTPAAALDVFRSNPGEFDLVITDLTMPQMSGVRLASELLRIRPDLPVILCTGNTDNVNPHEVGLIGIRDILTKPVTIQDLANSVRNALDGSAAATRALPLSSFARDEQRN